MQKFHISIFINAPKEKVWHTMLDEASYREWAQAFQEGSCYEGSWEKGSKIKFVGPDPQTGNTSGMVGQIEENRLYEFVSIKHVAIVENDVEDSVSEEAKKWVPAHENYTFTEKDGGTEVLVEIDLHEDHLGMFEQMWATALQQLKALAERELNA